MLDDDRLCRLFARVEAGRGDIRLTYFEMAALVALLAFRDAAVDLAILEVGLGGRLDAFNVVDADLAVVTSIGLDHQEYLGDDIEQIGREKAGVFRAGRPVVLGAVTASVAEAAAELGCPTWRVGEDFLVEGNEDRAAQTWRFVVPEGGRAPFPGTGLALELYLGPLAPANCALALVAAATLLGPEALDAAPVLAGTALPGRLELVEYGGRKLLVDVAHNPAGATFLAAELGRRYPGTRFTAVLSVLRDKDAAGIVDALSGHVAQWIAAPSAGARGQDARTLADGLGPRRMEVADTFAAALDLAVSSTPAEDGILVVGSFSAVEQVRGLAE
jgi:dihydrofolate synthase/folylpolyglutamate synthase